MTSSMCELFGHQAAAVGGRCVCTFCNAALTIVVARGEVFFGSLAQFETCFFPSGCIGAIAEWCEDEGHTLEFSQERPAS